MYRHLISKGALLAGLLVVLLVVTGCLQCGDGGWGEYKVFCGMSFKGGEVTEVDWRRFCDEHVTPLFPDGYTSIEATGYWKGSSMALVLDMLAAGLAGGLTGSDIDKQDQGSCTNCCQIFIAIDPYLAGTKEEIQQKWDDRVAAADATHPINPAHPVTCPGEGTAARREDNLKNGVKVDEQVWEQIKQVAAGNLDVVDIAST